jgi:hypothetical protein
MIKKFFILIAIGTVPSFITNDEVMININIDKSKYPKIFELLTNLNINIKYYWATPEELMAMEYLINKLNIPSSIKKEEIFDDAILDDEVDMDIIILIIQFYLKEHIKKMSFMENYVPANLEKINQLKNFVKDLNVADDVKEKLLDAYENNNEDFLTSVLDENNLKKYNKLWLEAAKERYELIVNKNVTNEEINEFILNIENLLSIKLSPNPSYNNIIKFFLNMVKNYIIESDYFNIIVRYKSTLNNMYAHIFHNIRITLTMIILDEIIKFHNNLMINKKFHKVNYPLINQIIYFSLPDIKKNDDPKKISRKDYEEKLKNNNIDLEYIAYSFWYMDWKRDNLDDIVNIVIEYKKKLSLEDMKPIGKTQYYWASSQQLMSIEYLIKKLNISSPIKKEDLLYYLSFSDQVDLEIIIPKITVHLHNHIIKNSFIKDYKPANLEKINQFKIFIKDLKVTDEVKSKLLDALYNQDEDFLKSVLDENNLKKYYKLLKEADEERYQLIISGYLNVTHEEINEFIVYLEKLLSIKLSLNPSSKALIKSYLSILKNYIVESYYLNIIVSTTSEVYKRSDDLFEKLKTSLTLIILDEIVKFRENEILQFDENQIVKFDENQIVKFDENQIVKNKFNQINYPLINQVICFSLFDDYFSHIKETDDPNKINRKKYEEILKKNNIDFEYIVYFFWYIKWNKLTEIKNLDDIIYIISVCKKRLSLDDIRSFV